MPSPVSGWDCPLKCPGALDGVPTGVVVGVVIPELFGEPFLFLNPLRPLTAGKWSVAGLVEDAL
jgi:hypothetical protein